MIVAVEDGVVNNQALATHLGPDVASVAAVWVDSKGKGGLVGRPQRDLEKNLLFGTERHRTQRAPSPRQRRPRKDGWAVCTSRECGTFPAGSIYEEGRV